MVNNVIGVALTIITPFGVLGLAAGARKLGVGAEGARKLVHILLSNWILLAIYVYRSAWAACILPAVFIPLNYISYRKGLFSAIERDKDNTPGTVWYAVSLFLLCLFGYCTGKPWIAACGMLAMGYGDGFGALIGMKFGKLHFPNRQSNKSLEGTVAVMVLSGLSVGAVCAFIAPDLTVRFALYAALSCAVPAGVIELISSARGIDNLTLPLGVGAIVFVLSLYPQLWEVFLCFSIGLLILLIAYYLRAITLSALIAASLLGAATFIFGQWISFIGLVEFFILGSAVSHVGKNRKAKAHALHERSGARSIIQVLANGLPALIFAILFYITKREGCLLSVIASFAAATADTFSSEIGMLSKRRPVSILTFKPIRQGLSGGITLLGFAGAVIGAALVSFLAIPKFGLSGMAAVIVTGVVSSIVDSLLGASIQAKYKEPDSGEALSEPCLTERREASGQKLQLSKGIKWINNDVVNFVSVTICVFVLLLIIVVT